MLKFISLALLLSCSQTLRYLDRVGEDGPIPKISSDITCDTVVKEDKETFASSTPSALELIPQLKSLPLNSIEKGLLWVLLHLDLRPDLLSPNASLQLVLVIKDKKIEYFDYTSPEISLPLFIKTIDDSLKLHSGSDLIKLASLIDDRILKTLPIDEELAAFLKKHQREIAKNEDWENIYMRGTQIIKKHERINKNSYKTLITQSRQKNYSTLKRRELPFSFTASNNQLNCNVDLNLYKNEIYPTEQTENSPLFISYISPSISIFAVAGKKLETPLTSDPFGKNFFKGFPYNRPTPLCIIDQEGLKSLVLSTRGRDPAQFLMQILKPFINDGLPYTNENLHAKQKQARRLYLPGNKLTLIESKRVERLNKNSSDYAKLIHAENLGELIFYQKENDQTGTIYFDDRWPIHHSSCQQIH